MKIRVKLFAGLRDLAGCEDLELELPGTPRVADVHKAAIDVLPSSARDLANASRLAVDSQFAASHATIDKQSEIALIPPVSGG
jgi:molybdopterin converting factor small subunit